MTVNRPVLNGVHHTARPTWKLRETVEFYRDKLGLPLVHAISARGWGPRNHPDFLHFFFDSGNGSTIAFFYYINTEQPDYTLPKDDYRFEATHTAWRVESYAELEAWKQKLEGQGIPLIFQIRHELIESIYFSDPNGYYLEITIQVRDMNTLDSDDAEKTLAAAMKLEDDAGNQIAAFTSIDQVWKSKAREITACQPDDAGRATLLVLDAPEFQPIVEACKADAECHTRGPERGYWVVESASHIFLRRKQLGIVPALWNAAITGGFTGTIKQFDRDTIEIVPGDM